MNFFSPNHKTVFDQARWERLSAELDQASTHSGENNDSAFLPEGMSLEGDSLDQFTILQLSDGDKRVLSTSEVEPVLKGSSTSPDINMSLEFESFKISNKEHIDSKTKATLQLTIGQEQRLNNLDKLFYCLNGGLDLWKQVKGAGNKADAKDFKKSADTALGNKPISLPGGLGKISFNVMKHEEPAWWQDIFSFLKTDTGKELISLVGFGGITDAAFNQVGNMLNMLFDKTSSQVLFKSAPIKLAFTESAKLEQSGGLSTNYVSSLNPGYWIMARQSDYQNILDLKPILYSGFGLLAPEGMKENEAQGSNNPFANITYAIIRARMKEIDLKQSLF